ncbi:triacylglycerol lipase [Nannocystis sp.]|uniref:esterase/lipase family protein n=1 Tax=Nannocystis sp. TaxID=1962667 RepID=UPI002429058F|nr:triacylglycerol lipase [Nannocystis sp.]MBK7829497.1 triacylglycerol lipase [Nannocystis sp.]MBK9754130.1 triacylglycerol lipase [Nannocystis sp.]
MLRPTPLALLLLAAAACGDAPAPGGEAGSSSEPASSGEPTSTTVPTTTQADASSGEPGSGDGSGDGSTGAPACDPDALALVLRDFIPKDSARLDQQLAPCSEDRWYFAAPSESTVEITLRRKTGGVLSAAVAYPDEPTAQVWSAALLPPIVSDAGEQSAIFPVPRSGEFAVHVRSDAIDAAASYDLEVHCILGCERETTRFPILLVHGWTGFENIGPLTYFYNVADMLSELGYPYTVAVLDPYNSTDVRSGQLAVQLDEALALWRARKVDLLGHSQGGIDSRAVVSSLGYGDRVSAVMTIASPHLGTYITDLALGLAPGAVEEVVGALLNFLGAVTAQQKSDALASFYSLSEQHMQEEFNPQNPDDPRVQYISYTGRTCDAVAFLNPDNHCQDLVDPLIGWSYALLQQARGDNDGLVTVESGKWGEYRGEMIADHIDEVGQILGITDPKFDHLAFYRDRARELAQAQH